ncbi:MAG: cyclic nucleotide-binding domain-containing protein, partial [Myxococcaceae bacterium]
EVSLLDGSPRPNDAVAAEDVTVLVIDRRDFLDLISDRPELLKGVFRAVSRQLKVMLDLPARRVTGEMPKVG